MKSTSAKQTMVIVFVAVGTILIAIEILGNIFNTVF